MKKTFILILLALSSINLFSQNYTAFDGSTFTVGDSIMIGFPSNDRSFEHIKAYDTKLDSYKNLKKNIIFDKYIIKEIRKVTGLLKKGFYDEDATIIEFGQTGFLGLSYYTEIDKAIKKGEIILNYNPNAKENINLNDTLAFSFFVKSSNKSIDNYCEEYLVRFMRQLFRKTRDDEFEYQKSLNSAKNELINKIDNTNFSQEFSSYTKLELGNYDFTKKGFPISINELNLLLVDNYYEIGKDYFSIPLIFTNFSDFTFVNIDENIASSFIKRRKDYTGMVFRNVYIKINFNLIDKPAKIDNDSKANIIEGKIKSIEFYDFEHCKYNWLGTIVSK